MQDKLHETINTVRQNKGLPAVDSIDTETRLREDLEMDSLDLAEFTVRVESWSGVDVFASGLVHSIGEVMHKLNGEK